ncbi:MAG: ATP-dependent DNA helicase [Acidobacteriota bacterium]
MADRTPRTLSEEQRRVVAHRGSAVQVIACAGSGKTETVSTRVASLIAEGVAPAGIIAFTFTDAAAAGLKTRILRKVEELVPAMDLDRLSPMYVGTIHAFCLRFLQDRAPRYAAFDLFEDHRLIGLLNREFFRVGLNKLGVKNMTAAIETFLVSASVVENEMLALDVIPGGTFRDLYLAYVDLLDRYRVLTHNQCIARAVTELERPEVFERYHAGLRHLIVDEFQDINPAQARLIALLGRPPVEVCVVGDDDQAIYQWRGSSVDYIRGFAQESHAHVETLGVNRRSAPAIVDLAARFALSIPDRLPKEIQAQRDPVDGAVHLFVTPTSRDEAAAVADAIQRMHAGGIEYRHIAILLRSVRTAGRPFLDELEDRKIPYTCVGRTGLFFQPEAETLAMVYAYLAGRDQLYNARTRQMDAVDLDGLLARLARLFSLDRRKIEAARHHLHAWREGLPRARDADLVGSYYRLLRLCDVQLWDAEKDAGRLGILARFSDVLADFESVTRRSRRMTEDEGAVMRGGLTGGQKYVDCLIDYISYYAQTHYEDFPGEPDFDLDAVTITTVHQAKGLEWPIVFVPSLTARRFPSARTGEPKDWLLPRDLFPASRYEGSDADERRLLYVALTRARDHLYISAHERVTSNRTAPSPYFEELGGADMKPRAEPLWTPTTLPSRPSETEDKPTFSFSELASYLLCPLSYRFRSRIGFQPPAAKELGYGKAVHHILRRLAELARGRGRLPEIGEVGQLFDGEFYLPFADRATFEQMRHRAEQLVGQYLTDYADDLSRVFEVERAFELHLPEANLAGRADVILDREGGEPGQLAIVDYKTRPETHHDPILALQLAIYTAAARGEGLAVRAAYLHDLGVAKPDARHAVAIDAATVEDARHQASTLAGGIRQRSFPPSVGSHCRTCDVRLICRHAPVTQAPRRNDGQGQE